MLRKILLPAIFVILTYGFWVSSDFKEIAAGVAIFLFGMLYLEEGFRAFTGGVLEIQPHLVTVLADSALHADQLDEDAALAARERAKEVLEGRHGEIDLAQAQAEMVEAEARYRAAQKLKGKRR